MDGTEKDGFAALLSSLAKGKACFSELLKIGKARRDSAAAIRDAYLQATKESLGPHVESQVFGAYFSVVAYVKVVILILKHLYVHTFPFSLIQLLEYCHIDEKEEIMDLLFEYLEQKAFYKEIVVSDDLLEILFTSFQNEAHDEVNTPGMLNVAFLEL